MNDNRYECPCCGENIFATGPTPLQLQVAEHFNKKHPFGDPDCDGLTHYDRQLLATSRIRWNAPPGWGEIKDCPA